MFWAASAGGCGSSADSKGVTRIQNGGNAGQGENVAEVLVEPESGGNFDSEMKSGSVGDGLWDCHSYVDRVSNGLKGDYLEVKDRCRSAWLLFVCFK